MHHSQYRSKYHAGHSNVHRAIRPDLRHKTEIIVLGTGEERYENMFRHFAWKYNGKVSAQIYYSLNRQSRGRSERFRNAGSSAGLNHRAQTATGTGTGFSFTNYNAHEMLATIRYAEQIYYDKKREWNKIIDRAMAADFSWNVSAPFSLQLSYFILILFNVRSASHTSPDISVRKHSTFTVRAFCEKRKGRMR